MQFNYIKFKFNLPNILTLSRIAAIPILLILYPLNISFLKTICAFIFLISALTDFLDGYIARYYNQITLFGKLLDPIADKILSACGLILLVGTKELYIWVGALLICRDFAISGIRLIALNNGFDIQVSIFGKAKTFFIIVGIFEVMLHKKLFNIDFHLIGMICLWIGLILSIYSAYLYIIELIKQLNFKTE